MSDILFGNNNTKTIKHLSKQYFKKNKVRNLAAILAIVLTAFLFTSITSLAFNMVSSMQLSMQMQKGSKADGTFGYMTEEQFEQLKNSDFVEQAGHRRTIGYASNAVGHSVELNYADSIQQELTFCVPTHGSAPEKANEIATTELALKALGVEPEITLGELREEIERAGIDPRYQIPSGMTKQAYLEMRLSDAIAEEDDYDLMVMGRTQGQGCYCFVNGLVQTQVQKLQSHYPYIVVDNEAGMEHISRGILPMMEVAILVSDCSRRGVQAAGRIAKLMNELNFKPQKTGLIVNRVPDGKLDAGTLEEIRNQGLELLGVVPHDDQVYQYDCDGKPIIRLPKDSPVRSALGEIVKKLGL